MRKEKGLVVPLCALDAIRDAVGFEVEVLDVLWEGETPVGCPYGDFQRAYVLEHNIVCIELDDEEAVWLQVDPAVLPGLGLIRLD